MGWFYRKKNCSEQTTSKDIITLQQELAEETLQQADKEHERKVAEEKKNGVKEYSSINFGRYEQKYSDTIDEIEWLVICENANRKLLLSKCVLDTKKFYRDFENVTWENSDIRKWLNDYFLHKAFSATEKQKIISTELTNNPNPEYGTFSGNKTVDKVFLLSAEEAKKYLDYESRKMLATPYVERRAKESDFGSCSGWWLRTSGAKNFTAVYVSKNGEIHLSGNGVHNDGYTVRPAIWVKQ